MTSAAESATDIALMFSGGLDSTLAADRLAATHRSVHLLTYRNGHAHWGFGRVRKRVAELEALHPGRIHYREAPLGDLFQEVVVRTLTEDLSRFGSGFVWCLGCKLTMHAHSLLYCRQNGIPIMADGSAGDTSEMVEQSLVSLSLVSQLYEDWGVRFETPVYAVTREEKRKELSARGLSLGIRIGERHVGTQPSCHAGEMYYLSYVLFNKRVRHGEREIADYVASRRERIDPWLAAALGEPAPST